MTLDILALWIVVAVSAVLWGYFVPLGHYLWRRTLLVDRRVAAWREERRTWRAAMRETRR